jgi:hypothetical protein
MDRITIEQADKELQIALDKYDWFYDTVIDSNTSITVYVHQITAEVHALVPHFLYGHHIKLGFASYLTCGEKYNQVIDLTHQSKSNGKHTSQDIESIFG